MKNILEKFIITLLIIMILTNFIGTIPVYAATGPENALDGFFNILTGLLGGLVGILTLPERLAAISVANAMNDFTATVAYVDNDTSATGLWFDTITPFDILFNKVKILDVNFFDITDATGTDEGAILNKIRKGVAKWFYAMRNIAAAILLCILIYVGIRMALSTVASDRAMYKRMLVDWVCSLLLIFVLQYIMLFTIYANNAIVNAISFTDSSQEISEAFDKIEDIANDVFNINALAATVVYCMLIWQTLGLFIAYFNRMIKIAFLIIISPLISITYSIDKMGDGKAQALGNWLKEFIFTILMQPFHCAIYMCMVSTSLNLLADKVGLVEDKDEILAAAIVSILCVKFIKEAEKLVRKIFSFADDNKGTSLAAGMMASSMALSKAKNIGGTAKSAVTGVANAVKNLPSAAKNTAVELAAMKAFFSKDNDKSFSEVKAEKKTEFDNKEAAWLERRNNKKEARYKSTKLGKRIAAIRNAGQKEKSALTADAKKKMIDEKTKEKMNANPGMKESQARAAARLEVEKERARDASVMRVIDRPVGKVKGLYNKFSSYAVVNELKQIGKDKIATGVGLMVGSGIIGTNGDIATAIMSGAATKQAFAEVLGPNRRSAVNDSSTYMKNLGASNSAQMLDTIDKVSNDADKYDANTVKGAAELDKLLKFLDQFSSTPLGDIESKIQNTLTQTPNKAPSDIEGYLADARNYLKQNNSGPEGDAALAEFDKNAAALTEYANLSALSASMNSALNQGMSLGEFKTSVISAASGADNYRVINPNTEAADDKTIADAMGYGIEAPDDPDDGAAQKAFDDAMKASYDQAREDAIRRSNADLTRLDLAFESELAAERQLIETLSNNGADPQLIESLNNRIAELTTKQAQLMVDGLAGKKRDVTLISTRLAEKYKKQIEQRVAALQAKAELDNNEKEQLEQLERLQKGLER